MAAKSKTDSYANIAAVSVNEATPGVLATAKFAFPFSIMDKMGLIIQRIEYFFSGLSQLNSDGDFCHVGLTCGIPSTGTLLSQSDPLVLDTCQILRKDFGTAAAGALFNNPFTKDFTNLTGGGLLVAPNPLYAAVISSGAAGITGVWVKLFYTYMELSTDEYWQLVESRRIISS